MARIARAVVPGIPRHMTQLGYRRQQTFFNDDDYFAYIEMMSEWCKRYHCFSMSILPYAKPRPSYPCPGNKRRIESCRFSSFIMDERYLLACTKYVELNPVRAGLVKRPEDWPWSIARPHITGKDDMLVNINPLLEIVSKPWE